MVRRPGSSDRGRRHIRQRHDCKTGDVATGRHGAVILEFAIVAPVVLLLLIGSLDLGLAVYAYNTLAEGARAGTRYAAVNGTGGGATASDVADIVLDAMPGVKAQNLKVQVSWPDGNNLPGSRVTVVVTYSYRPVARLLGLDTLEFSSSSTMTISS